MSNSRYERVANHDEDDSIRGPLPVPSSPPPPFSSRPASIDSFDPLSSRQEGEGRNRDLAEAFDSPSDDDASDIADDVTDHHRLVLGNNTRQRDNSEAPLVSRIPVVAVPTSGRAYGSGGAMDGVFANLSAKPGVGDDVDEKPPTYEQAAADAAPPYWETTILAPGMTSDEVYVDGLAVGSLFSFIWNAMISMSFQIVGFLLTYLLHTTHAAKNGSRAGLGITLVQYGFGMKGAGSMHDPGTVGNQDQFAGVPDDPNAHDFDPQAENERSGGAGAFVGISTTDWFAYILMVIGWFILIRSVSDFLRARRHEQLVLQSPDRGMPVPIVAEGEQPETAV